MSSIFLLWIGNNLPRSPHLCLLGSRNSLRNKKKFDSKTPCFKQLRKQEKRSTNSPGTRCWFDLCLCTGTWLLNCTRLPVCLLLTNPDPRCWDAGDPNRHRNCRDAPAPCPLGGCHRSAAGGYLLPAIQLAPQILRGSLFLWAAFSGIFNGFGCLWKEYKDTVCPEVFSQVAGTRQKPPAKVGYKGGSITFNITFLFFFLQIYIVIKNK